MVKRCSHSLCNSDDRYPDRLEGGVKFVPFPKPKTNLEACLRWIKLCGRPHEQLNVSKINSNRYVCTKHFVNQMWPTEQFPDPLPADHSSRPRSTRKPPRKRHFDDMQGTAAVFLEEQIEASAAQEAVTVSRNESSSLSAASQTQSSWVDTMDFMALALENETLKRDLSKSTLDHVDIERELIESKKQLELLSKHKNVSFSVDSVAEDENLMKYYTGFNTQSFNAIFTFLVPNSKDCPFRYLGKGNLSQIDSLSLENQLFLTLCKLRHNLDLQDLGYRFDVSQQVAGVIFNSWANYMFLRFGEVSFWPHRDVLYENMPDDYKKEYPDTFCIADCTEIKIQKPSSLKAQSQTYSDYKSTNTLKSLVVVDPRGAVLFTSMLFAGSMSDKEIFIKSGFQSTLKHLVEIGHLKRGDGLMADKGFDIEKEVNATGLRLNIPPFARSGSQMNQQDVILTKKIAKHRVHVERAIRRIKIFKILSGRISLSMISSIDQIWFVCSFLTNFMPPCIRKK